MKKNVARKPKVKKTKEKKDIVVFDNEKTPKDYNFNVVDAYVKAQKISSISVGRELGEVIGFIKLRSIDEVEAEMFLGILNRLLDIYIEAGTFNGANKIIPFKFKKISDKERLAIINAYKEKMGMVKEETKPKKKTEERPQYTG